MSNSDPISVSLFASELTAASGLFGLYDVLSSIGVGWEASVSGEPELPRFKVQIVAAGSTPFRCASGVYLTPDCSIDDIGETDIVVVPGINTSASQPLDKSYDKTFHWLHDIQDGDTRLMSACTGALFLAEAGLLNNIEATTHWAYKDLFRTQYPKVQLRLERNLCFTDANHGIVTSGGTTAWQELALFLIVQYLGLEQAVRTAKFWLLPDLGELQAPYMALPLGIPHQDTVIRNCQIWIAENYSTENPVAAMIELADLPSTTFARRFHQATGYSPLAYVQVVRMEEAKQMLETTEDGVEKVALEIGYEDTSSFRRLFKRTTGLSPSDYRKMFGRKRFRRYQ